MNNIAVIGGGASGLIAAISAARQGANVTIYEKNARVGKKILATGNGRCNYTNINAGENDYNPEAKSFIYNAFKTLDAKQCINYFESLGITPKIEEGGKVFPRSEQAGSILDVLRYELTRHAIQINCGHVVDVIKTTAKGYKIGDSVFDAVIVATGGKAMPSSGSDGSGYALAESFGHSIKSPQMGIVQLKLKQDYVKAMQGVKINAQVKLYQGQNLLAEDEGDILFANYGISGPPILQMSRYYARKNRGSYLVVNLFPELTSNQMFELLQRKQQLDKPLAEALVGLIHKKIIPTVLKCAQLDKNLPIQKLSKQQITKLTAQLTAWRFDIVGTKGWQSAQVTVGGINLDEVNSSTLASKFMPGIYFAGEVLDVDGRCGGYNLQWAWASGYVAGKQAAMEISC